jgi:hypothetical protein
MSNIRFEKDKLTAPDQFLTIRCMRAGRAVVSQEVPLFTEE